MEKTYGFFSSFLPAMLCSPETLYLLRAGIALQAGFPKV
jgi:hypothetical protein